ncbi:MAG: hypothetical protein FWC41_11395 [Firmicutes bacterium]|nr:hypothetical protein [Bacillota bacterium]
MQIKFDKKEVEKIKKLIKEFNSYYDYDDEFENETENWSFDDVDNQRQIGSEIVGILEGKF